MFNSILKQTHFRIDEGYKIFFSPLNRYGNCGGINIFAYNDK